jgi:dihydrofolate reductase
MKAIAAMSLNRVVGVEGKIPWHLPEDFRWFKRTTMGGAILMGRKTFESLGKPLPGRRNLVVSRHASFAGVEMIRDLETFDPGQIDAEVWVIGGAEIYTALLPRCAELYLSVVQREVSGDAFFPSFEPGFGEPELVEQFPEFEIRRYVRLAAPRVGI